MYFNAFFRHDLMNKDPKLRKKIKGITFEIGYYCKQSCDCCHGYECKYRPDYRYHNWSINVRRWIREKTGLDINFPWYFQRHRVDFSGTTMCPYKMDRIYTCYDCLYSAGIRECSNEMYRSSSWKDCHDEDTPVGRCKFFEVDPMYANYDKKTGEII